MRPKLPVLLLAAGVLAACGGSFAETDAVNDPPETRATAQDTLPEGGASLGADVAPSESGAAEDAAALGAQADGALASSPVGVVALGAAQEAALVYMREEEKLARDVYRLNAPSLRVFANIASSEQQHMDAVLTLLQRYGVTDPAADTAPGEFVDVELSALYDGLAQRSQSSLIEALRVGAEIEEIDLLDLEAALGAVTQPDIAAVYTNLGRASQNHLRAFTRNLAGRGEVYEPKHLDPDVYQEILAGAGPF